MLDDNTVIGGASVQQILAEELTALKAAIAANIRNTGQWASGATAESMQVTVSGDTATLTGRRAFGTLETGRKPGRVPRNIRDIIYRWMQAKGVHGTPMPYKRGGTHKYSSAQERGDWAMAGAVAHTIARQGTRLYRNGGRADVYSQEIPKTLERVNQRLSSIFAAVVTAQIKSNLKEAK